MEKFSITTAIDYVNGEPHIGHAYEKSLRMLFSDTLKKEAKNLSF